MRTDRPSTPSLDEDDKSPVWMPQRKPRRSSSTMPKDVLYSNRVKQEMNVIQFNKRISDALKLPKSTTWGEKIIHVSKPISKLGPGAYNVTPPKSHSPCWNFNSSPRFANTFQARMARFKFKNIEVNEEEKHHMKQLYYKNMNLAQYTPEKREETMRIKLENKVSREEQVKRAKESIERLLMESKRTKLDSKIIKHKMRSYPNEYREVRRKWLIMHVAFGIPSVFYWKATIKRFLRLKVRRYLRVLGFVCRILGKFKLIIKRFRRSRISTVIYI